MKWTVGSIGCGLFADASQQHAIEKSFPLAEDFAVPEDFAGATVELPVGFQVAPGVVGRAVGAVVA